MSEISKQALLVDNSTSFPNNNAGAITPADLRAFNVNLIDSTVNQAVYTANSSSWNVQIGQLNAFTASQQPSFNALNSFTASQIVTNTNLNQFTQSANQELDSLSAWTGSWNAWTSSLNEIRDDGVFQGYSTRFFFNGLVSASVITNIDGNIANVTIQQDGTKLNTSSFDSFSSSVSTEFSSSAASLTAFSASQYNFNQSATASIAQLLNLSSSLSGGYATQGELDQSASVLQANIDTKTNTSSFNAYTSSNDAKWTALGSSTGSFATTGSNTFTGDQTLIDAAGNTITLSDVSGSLMLVAKGFTSASAHFSASASNQVNLIFKNNNNTADTVISGSNNIFTAFAAPTAGFKRYIGGSSNYFTNTFGPQISGSMQFSPSMNRNIGGMVFTIRGAVSSSAWTMNENYVAGNVNLGSGEGTSSFEKMVSGYGFTQNGIFGGTVNITAGKTKLDTAPTMNSNLIFGAALNINHNSSSMNYNSNIQNGGITINNNYISASGATTVPTRAVSANVNTVYGVNHGVTFGGSNASTTTIRTWFANLMAGANISASLEATADNSSMVAVNMLGNGLIVSASSTSPTAIPVTTTDGTYGSVFGGRFNATDGARAKTAETVFAIGTGTSYSNRKTGFLIDSGSNTTIEGSLNVTGSLTITGSAYGNILSMSIASQTASMNLALSNFFTLQLVSGSTTHLAASNIRPGQTVNLLVTQPSDGTGSLSYNSTFDFPAGNAYVPTAVTSSKDIITLITFDSSIIYATSINNLV